MILYFLYSYFYPVFPGIQQQHITFPGGCHFEQHSSASQQQQQQQQWWGPQCCRCHWLPPPPAPPFQLEPISPAGQRAAGELSQWAEQCWERRRRFLVDEKYAAEKCRIPVTSCPEPADLVAQIQIESLLSSKHLCESEVSPAESKGSSPVWYFWWCQHFVPLSSLASPTVKAYLGSLEMKSGKLEKLVRWGSFLSMILVYTIWIQSFVLLKYYYYLHIQDLKCVTL